MNIITGNVLRKKKICRKKLKKKHIIIITVYGVCMVK